MDQLLIDVARIERVEPQDLDPWALFMRRAEVMERWGSIYVVHVRNQKKVNGLTAWSKGQASCPLRACMHAVLTSSSID